LNETKHLTDDYDDQENFYLLTWTLLPWIPQL